MTKEWKARSAIPHPFNQLELVHKALGHSIGSLSKRCSYCSKALAAYPLILSDEAKLVVYHAACAAALATDILADLYTFLSPPAPYSRLFVLTVSDAAPSHEMPVERE